MVLLLLIVIAVVIGLVVTSRRRRPPAAPDREEFKNADRPDAPALPTFDVVALGVSGSGKTVLLSSMFHELHVQRSGRPYILETDMAQRVMLNDVYRQVRDPGAPWPLGTKVDETRQFTFTCSAFSSDRSKHGVMRVRYLDYAGELFESSRPDIAGDQALLADRIAAAHALIGVIDGHRLVQFLRGEAEGHRYVASSLQPMIGLMSASTCPIHFVLTKWDVVHGFGEPAHATDDDRLAHVRDALLDHTAVGDLLQATSVATRTVRLIPVSAVGPDFVQPGTGSEMRKRPNARIAPTNVDVPFAATIPDLFHALQDAIADADRRAMERYVRQAARLDSKELLAALAKVISVPARFVLEAALGRAYGAHAVGLFLEWMGHPFDEKSARLGALRADRQQQIADARAVRARVMRSFEDTVLMLEARMPSSNLSRRVRS